MRNLTLVANNVVVLENLNISATTADLDENVVYAVSERQNMDGEVDVELWKVGGIETAGFTGEPTLMAMFSTVISTSQPKCNQVVSLKVIAETQRISIITHGGDITTVSLEGTEPIPDVEGTVEPEILAASWAPDESLLALVTGEGKLILMTSSFEVLSEAPIHTIEFGEDAPINVGWGSKQTQFHGSLGKSAAQAPTTTRAGTSPDDDGRPRISWRGDGAYFVISSLSPPSPDGIVKRVLRVYDRQAALQSTSEDVPGLEHTVVWRPSGNLIVGTQRFGFEGGGAGRAERHDVVFFERNGLRHGEFGLRMADIGGKFKGLGNADGRKWGYKVKETAWSSDSNILSIWVEHDEGDIVQLWTTGNYHWYLKQEIAAPPSREGEPGRFTSINWHPEISSYLILTTATQVIHRAYAWDTFSSPSQPPVDSGSIAVFDGPSVLLTPFRTQNVPPPMSSFRLPLSPVPSQRVKYTSKTPVHANFSRENDALTLVWQTGYSEVYEMHTRLGPGRAKVIDQMKIWSGFVAEEDPAVQWRQVALNYGPENSWTLTALGSNAARDVVARVKIGGELALKQEFELEKRNTRILGDAGEYLQDTGGEIYQFAPEIEGSLEKLSHFPEFCVQTQTVDAIHDSRSDKIFLGLGGSGKLHVTRATYDPITLGTNATSFTVTSGFTTFTTTAHEAIFVPLTTVDRLISDQGENGGSEAVKEAAKEWPVRKVERGSRIVTAVPSTMSLVLQMPRGNLETINPRPLVMEVVKQDLDAGEYRKAFFACRKHRIDLNVIIEHDRERFLKNVASFVEQVHEVDHLNLLLTSIGHGTLSPESLAEICDAVRTELERIDMIKYVNSILTAYVVKSPPDHEAGLSLLLRLRDTDPSVVEDAVKYIIFLVDADRLFDTALGMYDFSLVLMIAQHAQKDPREYLPFLRELRALDTYYQRFRIDDHLRRYQKALRDLSLAGPERFDEAVDYIEKYQLHEAALGIWKATDRHGKILEIYGDWLYDRREFRQAASVFIEAKKGKKAMVAHEKALEWQELFMLAVENEMSDDEIVETAYRVAEDLVSKKRHADAARVLLDYAKDVREAVIALVGGNGFSEARRIIGLNRKFELLEDVVYPAALESKAQFTEDLTEMREQILKQVNRLRELRIRKVEEPDAFYGTEDPALANVDVMTDASMAPTTFTRYTVAPTTASRTSKRSSRSKRKLERKAGSGRKGTVDEEEYLLKSVGKLVERFKTTQNEVQNLLPHLLQFTSEHQEEGAKLQKDIERFDQELGEAVTEIWMKSQEGEEPAAVPPVDTWAGRMEELEKNRRVNPVERVAKPEMRKSDDWKMRLYYH
ncbi:IkappaB kinase complex, IKAP component [Macrolepiota fuliginosa MF-IS2]|uniref:Elongator complex protein 1 n=1 Tax=Macrolepiota fuliginosa MF-IS2 TaxID=1400762 RepID=A0A9P6C3I3_9AGAR|nr:IkappaB kinase complex, IKAP component [Macrolepiota fuliginosa MF-IS2]